MVRPGPESDAGSRRRDRSVERKVTPRKRSGGFREVGISV
jgi:hypothetical protein